MPINTHFLSWDNYSIFRIVLSTKKQKKGRQNSEIVTVIHPSSRSCTLRLLHRPLRSEEWTSIHIHVSRQETVDQRRMAENQQEIIRLFRVS